ncbi:unnamed protein product [Paramecium pentaurelia]|uniref:Uncharacterized protein n=1 Tax=Paramecium pentaurelia TaxID=43138 RepID=A0A8S1V4R8_9CILI|nr:unnamed protein product [Paramecium pentaurelia]
MPTIMFCYLCSLNKQKPDSMVLQMLNAPRFYLSKECIFVLCYFNPLLPSNSTLQLSHIFPLLSLVKHFIFIYHFQLKRSFSFLPI